MFWFGRASVGCKLDQAPAIALSEAEELVHQSGGIVQIRNTLQVGTYMNSSYHCFHNSDSL